MCWCSMCGRVLAKISKLVMTSEEAITHLFEFDFMYLQCIGSCCVDWRQC